MILERFRSKQEYSREDEMISRQQRHDHEQNVLANEMNPNQEMFQAEQAKEREDLVRWQQDMGPDIEQFMHDLRREYWDEQKKSWVRQVIVTADRHGKLKKRYAPPLCNEICIQMIRTVIRPFLSKNEMMSNYNEDQIYQKLRSTMKTVVRNMGMHYHDYGIDYHDISIIRQTIQNAIMSGPFRALKQGEREYIKGSTKRIETVIQGRDTSQEMKRGGIFGLR